MPRLRRRTIAPPQAAAEPEADDIWPAYVDGLSAAFAFMLLAFFALMTRDAKQLEDLEAAEIAGRSAIGEYESALRAREQLRVSALLQLQSEVAAINGALPKSNPSPCLLAAVDSIGNVSRVEAEIVCTFSEGRIQFPTGSSDPQYMPDDLKSQLGKLAELVRDRACTQTQPDDQWCSASLEVHGHSDCVAMRTPDGKTEWELSTDRAGRVLRDMIQPADGAAVPLPADLTVLAVGEGDRRPTAKAAPCDCKVRDDPCHRPDRRVEVRFRVRSRSIGLPPPRPPSLKEEP